MGTLGRSWDPMQLTVDDVTKYFNVSEKTIYRWIKSSGLPAYQVNKQYRFNRIDLMEWAAQRKINVSPELLNTSDHKASALPSLEGALEAGGIHYRVGGLDKPSVLAAMVELLRLPERVDRESLLQILLAREELGSTAIGDGMAIPHARNPIVLNVTRPTLTLCFLEKPIEFGALDGRPVGILFSLISPTTHAHLHLLSRLSFLLRDPGFKAVVTQQGSREEILAESRRAETALK